MNKLDGLSPKFRARVEAAIYAAAHAPVEPPVIEEPIVRG